MRASHQQNPALGQPNSCGWGGEILVKMLLHLDDQKLLVVAVVAIATEHGYQTVDDVGTCTDQLAITVGDQVSLNE